MPKRALELYDDTLAALAERSPDAKPPVYLAVNRGRALETVGRLHEAKVAHESALKIAVDSKHTIGQVQALAGLAAVAIQLQDTTAAAAYLDRTSAVLGSVEAADKTPKVALIRGRLALALGHVAEARRRFEGVAATSSSKATAVDGEIGNAEALLIAGNAAAAAESARVALGHRYRYRADCPIRSVLDARGCCWGVLFRGLENRRRRRRRSRQLSRTCPTPSMKVIRR